MPLRTGSEAEPRQGVVLSGRDRTFSGTAGTGGLFAATGNPSAFVAPNDTAEHPFNRSFTMPAGVMNHVGAVLHVKASGRYDSDGLSVPTFRCRVTPAGNLAKYIFVGAPALMGIHVDDAWAIETSLCVYLAGSPPTNPTFFSLSPGYLSLLANNVYPLIIDTPATDVLFSLDCLFEITTQWSVASPPNQARMLTLEAYVYYPSIVAS